MKKKRLVRSERNKLVAGVCGGLAEYFDLDVNLVRLVCLVLIVVMPALALLYLLLVFVLPREGAEDRPLEERLEEGVQELERSVENLAGRVPPSKSRFFAGLLLVVLGLVLLMDNLGLWWIDTQIVGALLLIALGAYFLLPRRERP
jgi:phage shock protein C